MPKPPFILARETERTAIDRAVRDPIKRQKLYAMVDAVLRVKESGSVSPADLAPILAGFEATDEAVWSRAAGWLAKLHKFAPEISTTLEQLAAHRSATVRFNLCASLDRFPTELAIPYLRRFLHDRSSRVRGAVMGLAAHAGYRDLAPDMNAVLQQESDVEEQENLRETLALMQDEPFARDRWVVRKLPNGDLEYSPE